MTIGRDLPLSGKIIALIGAAVIGVCVVTIGVTYFILSSTFDELGRKELARDADIVQGQIAQMTGKVSVAATLVASNPGVAKAVSEGNAAYLKEFGKEFMKSSGGLFMTFVDKKGNVLARGHSDKNGDSILKQVNVQKALAGEASAGIEEGTEIKFSLRAGCPVKVRGEIVGSVSTGIDLSSNHSFVDDLKKKMGAECTIFKGDTRVSTTIVKDGQRAVGSKMDSPAVIEIVLKKGERFQRVDEILGKDFDTIYWPITGADGKIAGMLFVGKDREIKMKGLWRVISFVLVSALVMGACMITAAYFVTRSMTRHLKVGVEFAKEISSGNLTQTIEVKQKDEIGVLAEALNQMAANLHSMFGDISKGVQTLASASTDLSSVSGQTAAGVHSMSEKASTVAAAAEESSANTDSVAASMEQASTNLASVASATEQMSATITEIASNSEKARSISEQATAQAHTVSSMMQQLGQAATDIGKVTETITDISSQTNLLALNATIEAARAGAAGKGFAVVANEIKELARQTAAATEDIKAKIAGVQASTGGAIADIEKISGVIKDVGSIVASIAAAIEEQATVTKDVAGNIAQASAGVKEAHERVAQTATVSKSIAKDVAGVNAAVGDIRQGGEQVQASAAELSKLAEQLKGLVGKFKLDTGEKTAISSPQKITESTAGESLIPWREEFSVGVLSMDLQHKKLIALINRLHAALKVGEGAVATESVLKELIQYTGTHFRDEEEMMEKARFGGLAAQREAHASLIVKAVDAHKRWQAGDSQVTQQTMELLMQWLPQHIVKMDKQYDPRRPGNRATSKESAGQPVRP